MALKFKSIEPNEWTWYNYAARSYKGCVICSASRHPFSAFCLPHHNEWTVAVSTPGYSLQNWALTRRIAWLIKLTPG